MVEWPPVRNRKLTRNFFSHLSGLNFALMPPTYFRTQVLGMVLGQAPGALVVFRHAHGRPGPGTVPFPTVKNRIFVCYGLAGTPGYPSTAMTSTPILHA